MKIDLFESQSGGLLNEYSNWAKNILRDYPEVKRYRLSRARKFTWNTNHPGGLPVKAFAAWHVDKYVKLANHYAKEILTKRSGQPLGMYTELIARMVRMRYGVLPTTQTRLDRKKGKDKQDQNKNERDLSILQSHQMKISTKKLAARHKRSIGTIQRIIRVQKKKREGCIG